MIMLLVLTSFINVIRFIGVLKKFWLIVVYEVRLIIPRFLTIINWRMFFYLSVFCFIGNLISGGLLAGFYKRQFKMSKKLMLVHKFHLKHNQQQH